MPPYNFPALAIGEAFTFRLSSERDEYGKLVDLKRVRQAASAYKRRTAPEGWAYEVRKLSDTQGQCQRIS